MPSSQTAGRRRTFIPWRFPGSGGSQESFPCWSQAVDCREEGNGLLGHLCLHQRLQDHRHVSPLCPRAEEKLSTINNDFSAEDKNPAGSQYLYPPETKPQITDTNVGGYSPSSTMWGTQVFQLFVLSPVSDQFQQLVLASLATENTSHFM